MNAPAVRPAPGRSADVIVIGAGIHGCSSALHCALRGLSVIVLEKDHAGRHASGVNAGGVRQLARDLAEIPLSIASMALWQRIASLVDDDCDFRSDGQVLVAETDGDLEHCRARVADLRARGFGHEELLDARQLRSLVPALSDNCRGGIVSRSDGAAAPLRATQAFKRKAAALGASIREGVRVQRVARAAADWCVHTDAGSFRARHLVNAAGAWAGAIAADLGEAVPLAAIAPMLMVSAAQPAFIKPVVIMLRRKLSFKQFANGTVLIGGGYRGRALPGENRSLLDWRQLASNARTVADLFPMMRAAPLLRAWAGIEARMPDELPVLGASARHERAYHQFGFSGHGFQLGPGAGAVIAELIATGRSSVAIAGLGIARFAQAGAGAGD